MPTTLESAVVLLILLAPGFIAVRVKNSLLPYRPPSAFQETVEAALLSALLVPVWLLFAWRFLKARDHLIAVSTTLAPLDLWLFVPVVGVIALVYLVISPSLGVLYALVQARQPYTAVARKLIRGRLDAHVHPEVWDRAPPAAPAIAASAVGAEPQPQPSWPSALASASWAQQASTSAGAGPPQHESPGSEATPARTRASFGCVLHTPVAGRMSSTRRAPAMSPVSAQAIDRTCS